MKRVRLRAALVRVSLRFIICVKFSISRTEASRVTEDEDAALTAESRAATVCEPARAKSRFKIWSARAVEASDEGGCSNSRICTLADMISGLYILV